jgi:hypothetical protein
VLAELAYRPALIFPDSVSYLDNVDRFKPYTIRPLGYPAFLKLLPLGHQLAVIPAAQHVMGLAIGAVLYVLLGRLGVPRWAAALGAAPVLLDAYQVNLEEFILSETLFEALLVAAVTVLLWRPRPGYARATVAGLLFAGVALTRANGLILVVPGLLAALALRAGRRRVLAMLAAFVVPLIAYAFWFQSVNGPFRLTSYGGRFLYARVAPFADCSKFSVPADERVLCPAGRPGHRPTADGSSVEFFMWNEGSPVFRIADNKLRGRLAGRFARRVLLHQPFKYATTVLHDFFRSFALTRSTHHGELPVSRWQFQLHYPKFTPYLTKTIRAHGGTRARAVRGPARILRAYQKGGYLPGTVLAIALVAALLAAFGLGRARRSGMRIASAVFASLGVLILIVSVLANQFSWRYQIPALVLLPPAGVLGFTALLRARPADAAPRDPAESRLPRALRAPFARLRASRLTRQSMG